MTDFATYADRMLAMARQHGFDVYGGAPLGWRFEIPTAMWEAAKEHVKQYGWVRDEPWPGDQILGYPFVVDPRLPDDALRLVRP